MLIGVDVVTGGFVMAKPDWADKKVKKITWTRMVDGAQRCKPHEVANLLRAERRRVVRAVKKVQADYSCDDECAAVNACADILAALKGGK